MKKCLESSAEPTQILRAIAANHQSWFAENAQAEGGEVQSLLGATWTLAPSEGVLGFPCLSGATAGSGAGYICGTVPTGRGRQRKLLVAGADPSA